MFVMFVSDCHQLPEHCVLARILRTQQLNDLSIEHIVSLHSHLNKCFDDDPRLRFVFQCCIVVQQHISSVRLFLNSFVLKALLTVLK